jgi:murein DD-endopeptidase MepM/ murein hydrolase activator NlpD
MLRNFTLFLNIQAPFVAILCTVLPVQSGAADTMPNRKMNQVSATSAFVYPVMGPRMSSDFGSRKHPVRRVKRHHDGIDLAAPIGAPIRAIAKGQVMYADPHGGYGKYIVVRHDDGFTSHYGHCDKLDVRLGQTVAAGEIIGTVGSSGVSTGPHLHFEIRRNGKPHHPESYLPGLDDQSAG